MAYNRINQRDLNDLGLTTSVATFWFQTFASMFHVRTILTTPELITQAGGLNIGVIFLYL